MTDVLSHKRFQDEQAAYDWVEARLWPDGPECPRCGQLDRATKLKGKSTRIGVYKCKDCRKPFTVKVGTIFEDSHIPMRQVAAGHCVALRQQEGHQPKPAAPNAGDNPQVCMVHVAPD